jgi:hypothetical protein
VAVDRVEAVVQLLVRRQRHDVAVLHHLGVRAVHNAKSVSNKSNYYFLNSLRSIYTNSYFQCQMRQLHPTLHKKLGLILFFERCWMRLSQPTLKIMFMQTPF